MKKSDLKKIIVHTQCKIKIDLLDRWKYPNLLNDPILCSVVTMATPTFDCSKH